ncbi:MFS general substrate transporter [Sarocladium strictum]
MATATTTIALEDRSSVPASSARTSRDIDDASSHDEVTLTNSRVVESTVPDGGYGWVIVASCATLTWWAVGSTYAWGVMQTALVDRELSTPAVLSFIGGINASMISAMAILNSKLIRLWGVRNMGLIGVTCMGGSQILSSFTVNNLGAFFFTAGLIMGMGVSISFLIASSLPVQYFSTKRGLANGLISAGAAFGGATITVAENSLIQKVGVPWAYRVLGVAIFCTGYPAAWFLKERVPAHTPRLVEWALFKSMTFLLVFFAGAIGTFPLFVTPFFLPQYTKSLGFDSNVGAGLTAGFSLSSAVGRVLCGLACDRFGALNTLAASQLLTGLSMLAMWPASTTMGPLVVFVIVNGVSNGGFFASMPTVVANVFGSGRTAVAMSMILTSWIGGYLMGAPIAGYLLEAYGGASGGLEAFRPAMFYAGSLGMASCALVLAARMKHNKMPLARL